MSLTRAEVEREIKDHQQWPPESISCWRCLHTWPCISYRTSAALLAAWDALGAFMDWGVEFDDERLKYITVQVDRADIEQARAALPRAEGQ